MQTQSKIQLSTLSYVILYVKDTSKSRDFFHKTLGMKIKLDVPGWVELDTGSTVIALHGLDDKEMDCKKSGASTELVFQVEDVYAAYNELKAAGVKFASEPHQVCEEENKVGISATFSDLDENSLSIFSYEAKKKHGGSCCC